jgi:hypothetical protein
MFLFGYDGNSVQTNTDIDMMLRDDATRRGRHDRAIHRQPSSSRDGSLE